jgi:hypothetical protein
MGRAPSLVRRLCAEEGLKTGTLLFGEVDGLGLRFWDRGILSLWLGDMASCPIRQPWAEVLYCRDERFVGL